MLVLVFVLLAASLASGCSPTLRDRVYGCTTSTECPAGFSCSGGLCRTMSGSECRYDYDCNTACRMGVCENGYCALEGPLDDGSPCDDDRFCNGGGSCQGGTCVPDDVPPCPDCNEETRCAGCGAPGQPCCAGMGCYRGADCDGSNCQSCGDDPGDPCCSNGLCADGLGCDGSTCSSCDTPRAPCCQLFAIPAGGGEPIPEFTCTGGLTCVPNPSTMDGFPPVCATCGHDREPCCPNGCTEGVCDLLSGLCLVSACTQACDPQTICTPATTCELCGSMDEPCCNGSDIPCTAPGTTCIYGHCWIPTPEPMTF